METLRSQKIEETNLNLVPEAQFESAIEVLLAIADRPPGLRIDSVKTWFFTIELKLRKSLPLSVIEYTTLLYLHQKSVFTHESFPGHQTRLKTALKEGRQSLTGSPVHEADIFVRLPKSVLMRAPREEAIFHQTLFHRGTLGLFPSLQMLWLDYLPKAKDLVALVAVILLLATSSTAAEIFCGLTIGYLFSSFMEYVVHLYIAHATAGIKAKLRRFGAIGEDMLRFSLEHGLHHGIVGKNYIENFSGPGAENMKRIDDFLVQRGGKKLLQLVQSSQYGLSCSNHIRTQLFFFPASVLIVGVLGLALGALGIHVGFLFYGAFLLTASFWITTSAVYHPYLHKSDEEIRAQAGWLLRAILDTRLSRFIARSHRMHHALAGEVNQNLNLGADFLLGWAPIRLAELIDLKRRSVPF